MASPVRRSLKLATLAFVGVALVAVGVRVLGTPDEDGDRFPLALLAVPAALLATAGVSAFLQAKAEGRAAWAVRLAIFAVVPAGTIGALLIGLYGTFALAASGYGGLSALALGSTVLLFAGACLAVFFNAAIYTTPRRWRVEPPERT